jgi:hypothetical protein
MPKAGLSQLDSRIMERITGMLFYVLALIAGSGLTAYEAYKRHWTLAATWALATIIIAVLAFVIRPDSPLRIG